MQRIMQASVINRILNSPLLETFIINHRRSVSSQTHSPLATSGHGKDPAKEKEMPITKPAKKKTMAELDAELQRKMSGLSGDGGEAGVECENGQPVAMKRSVKQNMFRYI
ncbi:uncharacterized protein GGS22DRAFT_118841 [Annulohypoxylon maeteangense]|uniref:uncharacterized protein n=1 Tax=Annulohypoxylon maeteangense TaxID=1927788 RepID=UPI00200868C1|nr:uncharacterized protein GGS22DRAFT_118841 [Annulohypoxylon maeteangense]KAI0886882.1 hypothetical protein GGS22DRAFT_118841 [Annulohypoxylon maeteangense]